MRMSWRLITLGSTWARSTCAVLYLWWTSSASVRYRSTHIHIGVSCPLCYVLGLLNTQKGVMWSPRWEGRRHASWRMLFNTSSIRSWTLNVLTCTKMSKNALNTSTGVETCTEKSWAIQPSTCKKMYPQQLYHLHASWKTLDKVVPK